MSPLHEADSIIDKSVEISDCESNNSVNFIPLIATESGSHAIDISDILDFCEKENMPVRTAIREICEYNNIDTISFYVSESDYIESDELRHMTNLLQESGEDVYKVPVSDNNPIYICANKAIDELAYNDDGSLLESFMEDDYVPFSDSIYDSIINEEGHKRGANVRKASKLINKATTGTVPNGSDGQQQEPNANPPQQNSQSVQQNDANANTKPNNNNSNQPQTQNTTQQQQQQKRPNTNSSAQPTSNTNSKQSQPDSSSSNPPQQNTTKQQQQKQPNTNSSAQPTSNNNQSQPNSNGQPQQNDDQQDQQKEKQVESTINNIEKEAENKPAGFISSKIAALRKLYANWLAKKNQEHDQGKIGFFSNILRVITNCIDRLLAKLQGVKKAENNATGNNNAAGGVNNNNAATSNTNATAPQQQNS